MNLVDSLTILLPHHGKPSSLTLRKLCGLCKAIDQYLHLITFEDPLNIWAWNLKFKRW